MPKRPPPPPPASRAALTAALVLALAGLGVSLWLARLHVRAHAGLASFCAINDVLNCDRVATSPHSVVLGIPVAIWGALGFGVAAALAAMGLARRKAHPSWPTGLLLLVSGAAALASVALAAVSELLIGAFCIMCAVAWTLALAMLVAAWRAARAPRAADAIRADLAVLGRRPGRVAALAAAGLVAVVALAAAYPRYWKKPPAPAAAAPSPAAPGAPAGTGTPATPASGTPAPDAQGPWVVQEFSDYECPFCAVSHERMRAQLGGRADVTIVHRHFPLDPSCNPLLKRPMHPNACALAKAGICAELQGRGAAMDTALFENQKAKRPLDALARQVGVDVPAFEACLASDEAERRLAADVAEGIRIGVRATPTYVVNGVVHEGQLPAALVGDAATADR